jgi:hypothetical protein
MMLSDETEAGSAGEQPVEGSSDQTKMRVGSTEQAGLLSKSSLFADA